MTYYELNKDRINERRNKQCICECGETFKYRNKTEHLKTDRHFKRLDPEWKEKQHDKKLERARENYANNKENGIAWHQLNAEKHREIARKYYENHKKEIRLKQNERYQSTNRLITLKNT